MWIGGEDPSRAELPKVIQRLSVGREFWLLIPSLDEFMCLGLYSHSNLFSLELPSGNQASLNCAVAFVKTRVNVEWPCGSPGLGAKNRFDFVFQWF